jgi:hypothetical protein
LLAIFVLSYHPVTPNLTVNPDAPAHAFLVANVSAALLY